MWVYYKFTFYAHNITLNSGIDSSFGPSTKQGVIKFQTSQGLSADGIAVPVTLLPDLQVSDFLFLKGVAACSSSFFNICFIPLFFPP